MDRLRYSNHDFIVNVYDCGEVYVNGPLRSVLLKSSKVDLSNDWQPAVQLVGHASDTMHVESLGKAAREADGWLLFAEDTGETPLRASEAESLHLRVLDMGASDDSILAIARRYGCLNSGIFVGYRDGTPQVKESPSDDDEEVTGEMLEEWRYWLARFRNSESARQLAYERSPAECERLCMEMLETLGEVEKKARGFRLGMVRMQAYGLWLEMKDARTVAEWQEIGRTTLEANISQAIGTYCDTEFTLTPQPQIIFRARGLIASFMSSLALSLLPGAGTPKRCPGCGEWFLASHGKTRHCSDSCKTQAYRKRVRGGIKNDGD